ncbi:MAG: carboxypeptidase-like regulatory domain-containing protein, partial [Saprospiraceae bacterium]|nr:carboxypeptidase-like regulatory domain-containing protein [Saprospiraceae bacterium]
MKHLYKKFKLLSLLVCLLSGSAFAQNQVTGRITDPSDGSGVIGATVLEKGTNNGTVTDLEGNFVLSVASLDITLVVNYTGYTSQEVPLNGRSNVNISLTESDALLDEVVVVGYGVQLKSDVTGAVGTVKAKDIERIPTASVEQALQGKIAGVYVSPASGEPGRGATIRIRGTGTLNNASPLYVVDGMLLDDASFVNPQDVASIEV